MSSSSFCLKSGFLSDFEGFWVRRLLFLFLETVNGELKILQNLHLPLVSHAGDFRGACLPSLPRRDGRREMTWNCDMKLWHEMTWNSQRVSLLVRKIGKSMTWNCHRIRKECFYSSEKSGNLATKAQKNYKNTTLDNLPSTLDNLPLTLDILPSTLDKNLHSFAMQFRAKWSKYIDFARAKSETLINKFII